MLLPALPDRGIDAIRRNDQIGIRKILGRRLAAELQLDAQRTRATL
jgi:hypothetical protein